MTRITARILRLEPADGGWILSFYAPRSRLVFEEARSCVADLPRSMREYLPEQRAWWLSHDALLTLCERWPLLAEAYELAQGEFYQTAWEEARRQRSEHAAHRAHCDARVPTPPKRVADAFRTLCVTPEAPPELVSAARRVWSRRFHPDLGGDEARMVQVNIAADLVEQWLEAQVVH
jgi:hypothetical protein